MARRKPTQVQRNRQQQQRQREQDEERDGALEAADVDASNGGTEVIVIDDSSETDDIEVDESDSDSRPFKRRRGRGPWNARYHSWLHEEVVLYVNRPTQLHWNHGPWSDEKRKEALWLAVPVDSQPLLGGKLRRLEAAGSLKDANALGFGRVDGDDENASGLKKEDDSESQASPLAMMELCQNLGMEFESLVSADLVTMELQRTSDAPLGFVWRFGVDWRSYVASTATLPMDSPKLKSWQASGMRHLMAWLLRQNYRLEDTERQWTYPFPEEFGAFARWTENSTAFDIHEIYAKIDVQRQLQRDVSNIPARITDSGGLLLPTLRDYQKAALSWMLSREGVGQSASPDRSQLTRCVRFPLERGVLLFDLFCGRFSVETGDVEADEPLATDISAVRGGILADEMGLGKTVEVISLVLSHPSPAAAPQILQQPVPSENAVHRASQERNCICGVTDDCEPGWVPCELCNFWHHQLCTGYDPAASNTQGKFICFQCQVDQHLVVSCKTTLIVSPEAIHDQWESELKRHVKPGALTLLRYPGVKALRTRLQGKGPSADWRVLASCGAKMASYDIVLTTYEALASDLHHLPTSIGKERRSSTRQKRKKYVFVASPLVFLKFWRVCMDEAQVGVENTHLQAALTVAELRSEMQWIVTGTPFSTQVSDLYGCFKFLRVAPFCDDDLGLVYFREQIELCFSNGAVGRVLALLLSDASGSRSGGGLLWRTNKKDVLAQLGLPEQSQELVWCRFSDVERLFYSQREKEVIKALKDEQARRRNEEGRNEDEDVGEAVWHRLLMLRQVCCHPQVGQILHSIGASVRSLTASRGGANRRGRGRDAGTNGDNGMQAGAMNILTMDDFLQQLYEKCRRECEEAQRKLIAAHNGHASLALIDDDFATAVVKYMISVELIRSNWDDFRADLLPRLHILDNLANSVRRAFQLESEGGDNRNTADDSEPIVVGEGDPEPDANNPKQVSLMPDLTHLRRAITGDGLTIEGADTEAIRQECVALEVAADKIRRFYLQEIEMTHTSAKHHFESIRETTEKRLCHAQTGRDARDAMLCSSDLWWLDMLGLLQRLAPADVQSLVDRFRAHLYALGTKWSNTFAERFEDIHGLSLSLVSELVELHKKRHAIMKKLLTMSQPKPKKADVEMSGNCKKCRDARDGPVCWHCRFYKELEGYKQHLLGIDSTMAPTTSSALASWVAADMLEEEEDSDGNGGIASMATTTASTSLFLDIFRQLSSATRGLLRENRSAFGSAETTRWMGVLQDGLQLESDVYAQLLKEWNRAKKLFQAQHARLGALDELEMAQMKIRLRFEGEVVVTATDKLYKLQRFELPAKKIAFDSERVVAEDELKQKQSELRYLKHLKETSGPKATRGDGENEAQEDGTVAGDDRTCVVCLEDISKQRVTMLPCAHKTCVRCADRLANRSSASKSIRCPTCRRVFPSDSRKNVENDVGRAKELSLAARTLAVASDKDVPLLRSGFSSKIDAILRRVRTLATKNPELKALIFTQWQDMMSVLAGALQLNGIKCFTYTTKKQFPHVMQQFKHFPSACVLALPFKVGANGLNVVEATEVLLVEPLLNTSIEAQAINRIHRIGQTKATRVHRFVVDESVEEGIYWLGQNRQQPRARTDADGDEEMKDGDVDDSLVVGRQEKEKVTIGQLQALLQGRTTHTANEDVGEGDIMGMEVSIGGDHPFWRQRVQVNGREMSRREARELLERRRAAERRQAAADPPNGNEAEPVTLLVDRDVALTIAHELLQMKESESSATGETAASSGLVELIHMARQRVGEEMRVWQASQAEGK